MRNILYTYTDIRITRIKKYKFQMTEMQLADLQKSKLQQTAAWENIETGQITV